MDYKALLYGTSWNGAPGLRPSKTPVFLTFSFLKENTGQPGWSPLKAPDKTLARYALKQWEKASGIRFLEVKGENAEIKFQWVRTGADTDAYAEFPEVYRDGTVFYRGSGGGIYLNTLYGRKDYADRNDKIHVLLHEIGHALGLKHPFHKSWHNDQLLSGHLDHISHTVMSYTGRDEIDRVPKLGPLDVEAIQALYGGPRMDGKHVSSWKWKASEQTLTQIGKKGADHLFGVAVKDVMKGGRGKDRLYGFDGDDTLSGGVGNDVLAGGGGNDQFVLDTPLGPKNVDRITDFSDALDQDVIVLASWIFGLPSGALSEDVFALVGESTSPFDDFFDEEDGDPTVPTADHRIFFDRGTEYLYYDPDGSGEASRIAVAQIVGVSSLSAEDFYVI